MKEWTTTPTVDEKEDEKEGKKKDETVTGGGGTVPKSTRSNMSGRRHNNRRTKRGVGFGRIGVPKVEKRPTTTPISPMLGSRRRKLGGKMTVQRSSTTTKRTAATTNSSPTRNTTGTTQTTRASTKRFFQARSIPSSAQRRYQAGPMGVPTVAKRARTVPVSPCLGLTKRSATRDSDGAHTRHPRSRSRPSATACDLEPTTRTMDKPAERQTRRTTDNTNHAT